MIFSPTERGALFIDGANLFAAARALDLDIDYKKLLGYFQQRLMLVRALYYTALSDDQDYSPVRPLVDWLDYNGFTVKTKPTKEYVDPHGRRKLKGNIDVELTVDAMEILDCVDHIILFSGDGDYRRLVEAAQNKCCRVTVVSTLKSDPPMIADELRRQADLFLELTELANHIRRSNGGPGASTKSARLADTAETMAADGS